jgi:hypothetical protein
MTVGVANIFGGNAGTKMPILNQLAMGQKNKSNHSTFHQIKLQCIKSIMRDPSDQTNMSPVPKIATDNRQMMVNLVPVLQYS